jgi:hypothetical protein
LLWFLLWDQAWLVGVLVDRRSLDGEQEVPEVLAHALEGGRFGQPGDTSELGDAADLLTDILLSHLAYEERELIDPLARYGFYGYDQD